MNRTSLTRRLLAATASLAVGLAGALAAGAPASATGDDVQPYWLPTERTWVSLTGSATCDEETDTWTVEWTVTNERRVDSVISSLSSDGVDDFQVNKPFPGGYSETGTETFPGGTESATLTVELKWALQVPSPNGPVWILIFKDATETVELGECRPRPDEPEEPKKPEEPTIVVFITCDLVGFIIDNSEGDAEAALTFTPNQKVTHGHASGFSYTIDDKGNVEVTAAEGAGIHEVVGDADGDNPVVLGPFPAGADLHTHAFEAAEGLTVSAALTLDGEPTELERPSVAWSGEGLDCAEGEGGELPQTGTTTALIAAGAVALLALGGGLYLFARRRRVTFTA